MNMTGGKKQRKLVSIPVPSELHDQMAMTLHAALHMVRTQPGIEHYDAIAEVLSIVKLTVQDDERFQEEWRVLAQGVNDLIALAESAATCGVSQPSEQQLRHITNAVNLGDYLIARLDLTKMYTAMQTLRAMATV